jgi:hypothetical protein
MMEDVLEKINESEFSQGKMSDVSFLARKTMVTRERMDLSLSSTKSFLLGGGQTTK